MVDYFSADQQIIVNDLATYSFNILLVMDFFSPHSSNLEIENYRKREGQVYLFLDLELIVLYSHIEGFFATL